MWATAKKYAPYAVVILVTLYFRKEILRTMPMGVQRFFGGPA